MLNRIPLLVAITWLTVLLSGCQNTPPTETPDFKLTVEPSSLNLSQGLSGEITVKLERTGEFTGAVEVNFTGFPSGVIPASTSLAIPANTSSGVLRLTSTSTATLGDGVVNLVATGNGLKKTATLNLSVKKPDPDFSFTASPAASSLEQGLSKTVELKVTRVAGFAGAVQFDLEGAPTGFTSAAVTTGCPSGSACLKLTAAPGITPGVYPLSVRGVSGSLKRNATLEMTVTKSAAVTVSSLTAAPMTGPAPLQTSFAWTAKGLTGRTLTCTLDVNNDGKADFTVPACGTNQQAYTYSAVGTFTARLTVTDNLGFSDEKTLLVNPTDPSLTDVFFTRYEWGQSVLKSDLRLVAGKPAVLRAFVTSSKSGIPGVIVRATGTVGGVVQGSLDLKAPAVVPVTDVESDLSQSYWALLPSTWIKPGLEVKLEIDPGGALTESNESNNSLILKPEVGSSVKLYLTLVPVVQNGVTPVTPDLAKLKDGLLAYWPLADVDIAVRPPFTTASTDLSSILGQIDTLRDADQSNRYYYGFYSVGGGIGFIGYPVGAGSASLGVLAHELGHNFDQLHAPCGNPSGPDPDYPYTGALIGSWGFDGRSNSLVDPTKNKDLMSYCGPTWISDFMYRKAQIFLESHPPKASSSTPPTDLLLVRGQVVNGSIQLEPLERITGLAHEPDPGPYELRLSTATGERRVSFATATTTHEDGSSAASISEEHFSFTIPDPGHIEALSLSGQAGLRFERSAKTVTSLATADPRIVLERSALSLVLRWNAALYPTASLSQIDSSGRRTTLALALTGGSATVDVGLAGRDLGPGKLEVSLSDGINSVKQQF